MNFHVPTNRNCPLNGRAGIPSESCCCVTLGDRAIPKYEFPDPSQLSETELRVAFDVLKAHHSFETTELYRRLQRTRELVRRRVVSMRARPRMWSSNQESFVLQIVALLDVLGEDLSGVRDRLQLGYDKLGNDIGDQEIRDEYAIQVADEALELLSTR